MRDSDSENEERAHEVDDFIMSDKEVGEDPSPSPYPEGGYGWVVVAACFCGQFLYSLPLLYGLIFIELLDQFEETKSKTALVGSLSYGVSLFLCPLSGLLCDWIGHRKVNILGNIILSVGFLISAFSPNLGLLYFSYGCVVGIGSSLSWISPSVLPSFYFNKRRNIAYGIVTVGSSLGDIVLPVLIQYLIRQYTWRGAMIILAGFPIQNCVAGALFRRNEKLQAASKEKFAETKSLKLSKVLATMKKRKLFLALTIFCLDGFSFGTYYNIFPDRMVEFGYTPDQAAFLQSMSGVSSTVSRFIAGIATNFLKIDNIIIVGTLQALLSTGQFILALGQPTYGLQAFGIILTGSLRGVQHFLRSLWILQTFGVELMTRTYGFILFGVGVGTVVGPPIAGLIFQMEGSYKYAILVTASAILLAGLLNIPMYFLASSKNSKYK